MAPHLASFERNTVRLHRHGARSNAQERQGNRRRTTGRPEVAGDALRQRRHASSARARSWFGNNKKQTGCPVKHAAKRMILICPGKPKRSVVVVNPPYPEVGWRTQIDGDVY